MLMVIAKLSGAQMGMIVISNSTGKAMKVNTQHATQYWHAVLAYTWILPLATAGLLLIGTLKREMGHRAYPRQG